MNPRSINVRSRPLGWNIKAESKLKGLRPRVDAPTETILDPRLGPHEPIPGPVLFIQIAQHGSQQEPAQDARGASKGEWSPVRLGRSTFVSVERLIFYSLTLRSRANLAAPKPKNQIIANTRSGSAIDGKYWLDTNRPPKPPRPATVIAVRLNQRGDWIIVDPLRRKPLMR